MMKFSSASHFLLLFLLYSLLEKFFISGSKFSLPESNNQLHDSTLENLSGVEKDFRSPNNGAKLVSSVSKRGFENRQLNDVSVLSQPTSRPTLNVVTPFIQSASLSSDGRYCSLVFNTPTNEGGSTTGSFTCSSILSFSGSTVATCLWADASTIQIYPDFSTTANIQSALNVGSVIRLLGGNNIYSNLCSSVNSYRGCSAAGQQTVFALGPLSPVAPSVSIVNSATVSACSPLSLDLTGTTGDGQRGWATVTVKVTAIDSTVNTAPLASYIKSYFTTTVPIKIPETYLNETTYTISITLCNAFLVCGTGSSVVKVTTGSTSAPVVSLSGTTSTTVYASSSLTFSAPSYVIGCGGTTTSVGLTFTWQVLVGSTAVSVNQASKGSQLTIPAYSLQAGQTYTVTVSVLDKSSGLTTTASSSFPVQVSALVASISPSSMQLLRAGKSLTISGVSSYDPDDVNSQNGFLSYQWTCAGYTLNGRPNPTCLLSTGSSSGSSFTVSASSSAINSTATITLRVFKDNRNSSVSVRVQVIEGSAPLISIQTATSSVSSINTANGLLISSLVSSDYAVSCVWSSSVSSLDLSKASLTGYTKSVPGATPTTVNLYIAGNSLAVRSTYVFTLACLSSAASITVTTNGPPVGGSYSISPTSGVELTDLFTASTSSWSDQELPITYLFGFISPSTGLLSTVQSRSTVTYTTTTLPGGLDSNGFAVNTVLVAFDNLNCSTQVNGTVTVNLLPAASVAATISSQLNATKGSTNLDDIKEVISVASSTISRVNCTGVTNCASLNRAACAATSGTCGSCLTGYVGQQGDANTLCVSSGSSSAPEQQCNPSDCSGNGVCKLYDLTSNLEVSTCSVLSATCYASCVCSDGFFGTSCAFTQQTLQDQQSLRSELLSSLSYVVQNEDTTTETVTNVVSSISGIVQSANDVSADSVGTFSSIAQTTLTNAVSDASISASSFSGLLGPTDSAINAAASAIGPDSALALGNTILTPYTTLLNQDSVAGLPATTAVFTNFRLVQQTVDLNETVSLQVPQTAAEAATKSPVSSISVVNDGNANSSTASLQIIQYNANLLPSNFSKFSSIVQAQFSSSGGETVLLTLANNAGKIGPQRSDSKPVNVTTHCAAGDYLTYTYSCPTSDQVITHSCHGIKGNLMSYCPVLSTACASVNLTDGSVGVNLNGYTCDVSNVTTKYITCKCYPSSRRRLESNQAALQPVLTACAMAQYTAFQVGETFEAAPDLTSPAAIEKALIVIVMFCVLWAGGLLLITGCFIRQRQLRQETVEKKLDNAGRANQKSDDSSIEDIRERLTKYADSVFPVIFYPGHWLLRLKDEIRRNHRYLMMFMLLDGELEGKKRYVNGIQLLTIQSALMFLLALLYDIQSPTDDGTCPGYTTEAACLNRKSVFDTSRTYCVWTDTPPAGTTTYCSFNDAEVSFQATIYIQVIVSVMSALFMRPLYYLFDILLAPNVDNMKAKLAEEAALKSIENVGANRQSMVGRVTRRVGRVANSVASMIKFTPPKHVDPKELENMPITLIPDEVEMVQTQAKAYFRKLTQRAAAYEENAPSTTHEHGRKSLRFTMMKKIQNTYAEYVGKVETEHKEVAVKKWEELQVLIVKQRGLLKPEELAQYDKEWGLDPATGQFLTLNRDDKKSKDVAKIIQKELALVERNAQETIERLHLAVDGHIGLEILHKFILDILGHDTPAARIFANKTEEDFKRSSVKTRREKVVAAILIFGANALFVYYSILRGYVQGVSWQKSYLIACLVQMMLEIYLFETIECIWINVFVPSLVSTEVQRVNNLLLTIINDLCNKANMGLKLFEDNSNYALDVTKFLFASTRVAEAHPQLMESLMVRTYHSHLPGEISRKWTKSGDGKVTRGCFSVPNHQENVSIPVAMIGSLILTLQIAAMTPFDLQKMFIRFVQPFLYGGLVLVGDAIISNPIYIAVTAVVIVILVALLVYQYWKDENSVDDGRLSKIQPIGPVPVADEAKPFDSKDADALAKKKEMEFLKVQRESLRQKASSWAIAESKSHSTDSEDAVGKEYNIRTVESTSRVNNAPKVNAKTNKTGRSPKARPVATSSVSQDGKDDQAVYHQWESSEEKSEMGGGDSYLFSSSESPTKVNGKGGKEEEDEEDLGQLHKPKAKSNNSNPSASNSRNNRSGELDSFASQSLDDSFHPVK